MHYRNAVIVLLHLLVVPAGCATRPAVEADVPADWQPSLDQPIRQLEDVLAATEQQQSKNYTSANLGFVLDAKLYLLFERYLGTLAPSERAEAIATHRRWREARAAATSAAYNEYAGGTFASYAGNGAFIEYTRNRISAIERATRSPAILAVP